MSQPTLDPDIVIDAQSAGKVTYRSISTGEKWAVHGVCNQCGLCVVGAAHPEHYRWLDKPGIPFAVVDLRVAGGRLDEPITPRFNTQGCCLTIEVLDGH